MKIVVIGGSGLIGRQLVDKLRLRGREVLAASPSSGVNAVTGEGLDAAMDGASVVVDVSNSPSFADLAVSSFFKTSTRHLLRAGARAGVKHHIALSVVGADRVPDSGYLRAKVAQEELIRSGDVPYTIVRATQFFEFLGMIAASSSIDGVMHMPTAKLQPIAAEDVAEALTDIATGPASNATIEVAGPQAIPLDKLVRRYLSASGDPRTVVGDVEALYFGARLDDSSLTPGDRARIGAIRFERWLERVAAPRHHLVMQR